MLHYLSLSTSATLTHTIYFGNTIDNRILIEGELLIKSKCIAITGGIGCGKSTIAELIADQGYTPLMQIYSLDNLWQKVLLDYKSYRAVRSAHSSKMESLTERAFDNKS